MRSSRTEPQPFLWRTILLNNLYLFLFPAVWWSVGFTAYFSHHVHLANTLKSERKKKRNKSKRKNK